MKREPGTVRLKLNSVTGSRLERLLEIHPKIKSWPAFQRIQELLRPFETNMEVAPEEGDALLALFRFLHTFPELSPEQFDVACHLLVTRIRNKGGMSCPLLQVPDLVYECQVACALLSRAGEFVTFDLSDEGTPDGVVSLRFSTDDQPYRIAIECKNVGGNADSMIDMVRAVTEAIRTAVSQHARRVGYDDLFIYLDLPSEFESKPLSEYACLVVNVWKQLELEGIEVDEVQVFFTACARRNMGALFARGAVEALYSFPVLPPLVIGKREVVVSGPRAVLLSVIWRSQGEAPNVLNYSKHAIRIDEPESYLLK